MSVGSFLSIRVQLGKVYKNVRINQKQKTINKSLILENTAFAKY